jgi:hypothetical protein
MIALMTMAMPMPMDQPMPSPPLVACTPAGMAAAAPVGWNAPVVARSGATIATGRAASLALEPAGRVGFAMPPARAAPVGAVVSVVVPRAGHWRVSLDAPVWIDMVGANRKAAVSINHAHGARCSGVAKIVDFDLPAGRYVLQLTGATARTVRVMVSTR